MPSVVDDSPKDYKVGILNYPPGAETFVIAGYSHLFTVPGRPNEVLKVPAPFKRYEIAHKIERRVYRRLGKHRNIATVVDMDEYGIYLKKATPGCLRLYYKEGGTATLEEKIKWCQDLAEVLEYIHQNNVRHGDLSGRNLLIDSARNILLCDFGGSFIDDEKATVVAESGYRHPDEQEYRLPTIRAEVHALGSTIYEIVTGLQPHQGLEDWEVDKLLEQGKYPDVSKVPLGNVIAKCWKGGFDSAAQVAQEIAGSDTFCYPRSKICGGNSLSGQGISSGTSLF